MDENKSHDNATTNQNDSQTFTQAQLDSIVNKRLEQERAKFNDYEELKKKASKLDEIEEAKKTELQKANEKATALQNELDALKKANEIRNIRDGVARELNVPSNLLTADTKEACEEQAKALLNFASSQNGYPTLKDGGELNSSGAMSTGASTKDLFAQWMGDQ